MNKKITIVGFGDSITEASTRTPEDKRWLFLLQKMLSAEFPDRTFNVINSGIGGNSAREAMSRFEKDVLAHAPDYVLLEFGGNNNDPDNAARRVPPDEFKALLEKFRKSLPAKTKAIIITFPPVFIESHFYWKNPVYREYLTASAQNGMGMEDYIAITREFGHTNGYPIYDCHKELLALGQAHGWQTYTLDDGVHLTEKGNAVLAEGVFAILKEQLTSDNV